MSKTYKPKTTGYMVRNVSSFDNPSFKNARTNYFGIDSYLLENFKSYNTSEKIDFSRINLIFGQNSSGKSALLQSLLSASQHKKNLEYKLDLHDREFLEVQTPTIDLGDFKQIFPLNNTGKNKSKEGIKIKFYSSEEVGLDISIEYIEDKADVRPRINSFKINFKDSSTLVSTSVRRKHSTDGYRSINTSRGASADLVLNGSITGVSKTSTNLKKDFPFLNERFDSEVKDLEGKFFDVDCSSLELRWIGKNPGFKVPEPDRIVLCRDTHLNRSSFPGLSRSAVGDILFGVDHLSFTSSEEGVPLEVSEEYKRDTAINFFSCDSNLKLLNEIINRAFGSITYDFVHIPPIRGIPTRISTKQDILDQDPSVAYVYSKYQELQDFTAESKKARPLKRFKKIFNKDLKAKVNQDLKNFGKAYDIDIDSTNYGGAQLASITVKDADKRNLTLLDVGRGISQLLPILVSAHAELKKTIIVEQPEVHIHPKLQADLGDIFIESDNQWIIETHSENILFRIQRRIREGVIPADQVKCIYIESIDGEAKPLSIGFREDGSLERNFPQGFFDIGLGEILS